MAPFVRFWKHLVGDPTTGCWLWVGATNGRGYGQLSLTTEGHRRTIYAHRFSYEQFNGPIPESLQIDHLCRVRNCVNPDHLETVTPRENQMRSEGIGAKNARKTHCVHGHELTAENVYVRKDNGSRMCRACALDRRRASAQKRLYSRWSHERKKKESIS